MTANGYLNLQDCSGIIQMIYWLFTIVLCWFLFAVASSLRSKQANTNSFYQIVVSAALLFCLIALFIFKGVFYGTINYNPTDVSVSEITGLWVENANILELKSDGSCVFYTTPEQIAQHGTWTKEDWFLNFKGISLTTLRIIRRNNNLLLIPHVENQDVSWTFGPGFHKKK